MSQEEGSGANKIIKSSCITLASQQAPSFKTVTSADIKKYFESHDYGFSPEQVTKLLGVLPNKTKSGTVNATRSIVGVKLTWPTIGQYIKENGKVVENGAYVK